MLTLLLLLRLEMYSQPQHQNQQQQQQQQQGTVDAQPASSVEPVVYVPPAPAPLLCHFYDGGQSKVAGIILIIVGALSIIFNIIALVVTEVIAFVGHGFWCGTVVSCSLLQPNP